MKNGLRSAVVTAVGGGVGESVLRAMCLSSIPIRVIGTDPDPWSAGLYVVSRGYTLPKAKDTHYLDSLIDILSNENASLLIPGSDPEIEVLGQHRFFIEDKTSCMVLVGGPECTKLCRDKLASSIFFREKGFPFVHTVEGREAKLFAQEAGFPLVVKPRGGSASKGVQIVFTEKDLEQALETTQEPVVQEYLIPKSWGVSKKELKHCHVMDAQGLRQEEEVSLQVLLDHTGELLGIFTSRNVLRDGVPIKIDPWPNAPVEPLALEMAFKLKEKGLIGPCNFQCKLTDKGPEFFEVNPRFTGITAVRAALGFNEVEAVLRRALLDEPSEMVKNSLQIRPDLVCRRYITELLFSRKDLYSMKEQGQTSAVGTKSTFLNLFEGR